MNVCIKCNPVTPLTLDEAGEFVCRFHGRDFVLEVQPDPVVDQVEVDASVETAPPDVPNAPEENTSAQ